MKKSCKDLKEFLEALKSDRHYSMNKLLDKIRLIQKCNLSKCFLFEERKLSTK